MTFFKKILLLFCVIGAVAFSQEEKTAYVHMVRLFEGYYKTITANVSFEREKMKVNEKISVMQREIEQLVKEIRSAEEEAKNELLSDNAREQARNRWQARVAVFEKQRAAFERSRQDMMGQLRRIQLETEDALSDELLDAVKKYAAAQGYGLVWDVSGRTMNRLPALLVYPESRDVTQVLLRMVNQGHEEEIAEARRKLDELRKPASASSAGKDASSPSAK